MTLSKIQHEKIDPKNPWLRDKLERKKVADYLTPVLASIRQPFVISLHSPYGTGKSFFLECWKADLEAQGYTVVLFDAWKTDFSNDPLSAFISSLKHQTTCRNDGLKERWLELAKRTAGILRSHAVPLLIKGALRKALGKEGFGELEAAYHLKGDEVAEALSSAAVEALNAQEAAEHSMMDFRDFLAETAQFIVENMEDPDKKKLIIFVDELDRCKPSYAIEVLECIKHLFAVHGTVFVLAFDENQMREAISSTYGLIDSGEGYLRKFIDWQFTFPLPSYRPFADFLFNRFALEEVNVDREMLNVGFAATSDVCGLSLREQEQVYAKVNLLLRSIPEARKSYLDVIGVVVVLFHKRRTKLLDAVESLSGALSLLAEMKSTGRFIPHSWDGNFISWFLFDAGVEELQSAMLDPAHKTPQNDVDERRSRVLNEAMQSLHWWFSQNMRRPVVELVLDWMQEVR